jgi:hypothetical protein
MVAMLVQVVKGTMKEKVIRMMLAIMVNLIDTGVCVCVCVCIG